MDWLKQHGSLIVVLLPLVWLLLAVICRRQAGSSRNQSHACRDSKLITLAILCGNEVIRNRESGDLPTMGVSASEDEIDSNLFAQRMLHRMSGGMVFNLREMPPMQVLCQSNGILGSPVFVVELSSQEMDECNEYWSERYWLTPLDEELECLNPHTSRILQEIREYRHRVS